VSLSCSSAVPQMGTVDLGYSNKRATQWRSTGEPIEYASKSDTIMLMGGLSPMQDGLIEPALRGIGEHYIGLPNADFKSFQIGKSFGNRGQCNPTYFTVGNLVKYLQNLRDNEGISSEEIVRKYLFVTAGGCGPCRFGMYITEYNKALNDAGFYGFRVMSFEHNKGIFQATDTQESVIDFSPKFFMALIKAFVIGDIINLLGYRVRPYEVESGTTDRVMEECKRIIAQTFEKRGSLLYAMYRCRKLFATIELDRLQPKPKVMITGEFWATLTEGDGNYNLHKFLEAEGAECIPQPLVNRLLLSIWEAEYERSSRENLVGDSTQKWDFSNLRSKILIKAAKASVVTMFGLYAKAIGLTNYHLADMDRLAKLGGEYYPIDSNGGEGHLEVAHLIESFEDNLSHLILSIKPFGCMPSSAVSDGIQSLVQSRYPDVNFLSLETSGEGAANFYSRVQMVLYKAKKLAQEEFEDLTISQNIDLDKVNNFRYNPPSTKAGTASSIVDSLS